MKIEKLNDRQLRFTLTREDLASHHIKLSELSYGSEKARSLFMEMMQQAARDFDFVVNNTPLMIEAIPISADAIILIVTKVDNPEELDSRFARFSKEDGAPSDAEPAGAVGADDILDLIGKLNQLRKAAQSTQAQESSDAPTEAKETAPPAQSVSEPAAPADAADEDAAYHLTRFYVFYDLETIVQASHVLDPSFDGPGSLFKNPDDGHYYLLIQKADTDPALFNKVCNVISEYGMPVDYSEGMEQFFTEHMDTLLRGNALQSLRQL